MSEYIISIGNFNIRWYSVLLLVAVVVGFLLLAKEGRKYNYSIDFLFNMFFWMIIFGFIGARAYYG